MMKKYAIVFFVFSFITGFSQNSNTLIQNASGNLLSDMVRYCPGEKFSLKVNDDAASTDSYTATKETRILPAGSTDINFDTTDPNIFSKPIEIGFGFNFYGKTYTKVVVGRNGRLVFTNDTTINNLHDVSTYKDRTFSGITGYSEYAKLPSKDYNKVDKNNLDAELNLAQIFFGYTDLIFNSTYATKTLYKYTRNYTAYGRTGLLISIQYMIQTDGRGYFSSSNAYNGFVWLLNTGEIIIRVVNKTDQNYNAILGMQDETGTKFFVPAHSSGGDYNNGKWRSEDVTWGFKANLKRVHTIEWFVDDDLKQTGNTYQFSPSGSQNLKVKITYEDNTVSESTVDFSSYSKPEVRRTPQTGCAAGDKLEVENPVPGITYHWYKDDIFFNQGPSVIATTTGNYTVKPENCNASQSDPVSVKVQSDITPIGFEDRKTFLVCDNANLESEKIALTDLVEYKPGSGYTIEFYKGSSLVASAANGYEYAVKSGIDEVLTLKVSSTTSDCSDFKTFVVRYLSFPEKTKTITTPKLCYGTDSYTLEQFRRDFPQYSGFEVSFPTSVNPQTGSSTVTLSKPGFSCTADLHLNFTWYDEVIANTPAWRAKFEQCASSETFESVLNSIKSEINDSPNVDITYYHSHEDASTGNDPIDITQQFGIGTFEIFIRVKDRITNCVAQIFPSITLKVYRKPTLKKNTIEIRQCEGETIFDLTQKISDLVTTAEDGPAHVGLEYYSSDGTRLTESQIRQYDASVIGMSPKIYVRYNPTCYDVVTFNLTYHPKPTAKDTKILICSETTYSKNDFLNRILDTPSAYAVTRADDSELPSSFDLSNLPLEVEIFIKNNTTGCLSDPISITFEKGDETVLNTKNTDVTVCDTDFDGFTTINLTDYLKDLTSDTSASVQYFSDASLQKAIDSPNDFTNTARNQKVYVRIQSAGFCPSIGSINLTVNTPAKSTTLQDTYYICYGDQLIIDAGTENTGFRWSGGDESDAPHKRRFTEAGTYSVTLTNASGCSYTHHFGISDEHQPKIRQINQTNDKIEVIAEGGSGTYEYSFDEGRTWQPINSFLNPTKENYIVYVRSVFKNGDGTTSYCNGASKSIYTIKITNVITPNGDGKNDTWTIPNLNRMQNPIVIISDRYGKTVYSSEKQTNVIPHPGTSTFGTNDFVWDGKSNGNALPTGTYWYMVKWYDPATLKNEIRTGWILLKNRD